MRYDGISLKLIGLKRLPLPKISLTQLGYQSAYKKQQGSSFLFDYIFY